jgi:hypothetical protein
VAKRATAVAKKKVAKKAAAKKGAGKAPAKKSVKKTVKAGSRGGAKARAGAGKPAARAAAPAPLGMFPVTTGAGATPSEIGAALVEHFNAMRPDSELWDRYFHERWESIEGFNAHMGWRGRAAVEAKSKEWIGKHAVHAAKATGPFVGSTGFAVHFEMDVEEKATGKRMHMREVGVYTVQDGKVVREEFMYSMS